MTDPDKPIGIRRYLPFFPFAVIALPVLAGAFYALNTINPETVCEFRIGQAIHQYKANARWCLITGGSPKECLK